MIEENNIIVWLLLHVNHLHNARLFDLQAYLWRVANERAAVTRFGAGATLAQTPTSVLPRRLGEPLGEPD